MNKSRRDFTRLLNRNKSELETIHEKVKEEEIAAMSASNLKHIDIEESYSFSLRNYPSHKNAVYGGGNLNGRNSNIKRHDDLASS